MRKEPRKIAAKNNNNNLQKYSKRKLNLRITTTVVRATTGTKQIAAPTKNEFGGKEQTAELAQHKQPEKKQMEKQNTFEKSAEFKFKFLF